VYIPANNSWGFLPPASSPAFTIFSFFLSLSLSFSFFHLLGLAFKLRASHLQSRHFTTWATSSVHFGYFGDGVPPTIWLGWPWTMILPISASQVARITGVSHQHLAYCLFSWW
jgi:hypothetical protein